MGERLKQRKREESTGVSVGPGNETGTGIRGGERRKDKCKKDGHKPLNQEERKLEQKLESRGFDWLVNTRAEGPGVHLYSFNKLTYRTKN